MALASQGGRGRWPTSSTAVARSSMEECSYWSMMAAALTIRDCVVSKGVVEERIWINKKVDRARKWWGKKGRQSVSFAAAVLTESVNGILNVIVRN